MKRAGRHWPKREMRVAPALELQNPNAPIQRVVMLESLTYPGRPTIDSLQLRFLDAIARQWRDSGEWPRTEKIRLRLRAELDFDRVVATVRGELSQPIENPDRRQNQTRLTDFFLI